jgi:urease accessory protein
MLTRYSLRTGVLALIALAPSIAWANTGIGPTNSFLFGVMHPISGLDHVLAMTLVGLFAYRIGGRALWLVPVSFVTLMLLGGILGFIGATVPFVEAGIALSVVVLGAAVAFSLSVPVAAGMALVGLFAIFHGHAHGSEVPDDAGGLGYGLGFMLATALLHAAGIGMGVLISRLDARAGRFVSRAAGGFATIIGAILLTQAV